MGELYCQICPKPGGVDVAFHRSGYRHFGPFLCNASTQTDPQPPKSASAQEASTQTLEPAHQAQQETAAAQQPHSSASARPPHATWANIVASSKRPASSRGSDSDHPIQRPRVGPEDSSSSDVSGGSMVIEEPQQQSADLNAKVDALAQQLADLQRALQQALLQRKQQQQHGEPPSSSSPPLHQRQQRTPRERPGPPPRAAPSPQPPPTGAKAEVPAPQPKKSSRAPRASPPPAERLAFIVRTPKGVLPATGSLAGSVAEVLYDHIPQLRQQPLDLMIRDACRVGDQESADRVYITVNHSDAAEALVSSRHALRGTAFAVFDVLSPKEQQLHDQLWPLFLAARASGQKAQFKRARLFVDDKQVHPSSSRGRKARRRT